MTGNAQKTHFARSINEQATQKALSAIQTLGKSLPCHVIAVSGSIVTVRFDIRSSFTLPDVTCPMNGPEYLRFPIQAGDENGTKGVAMSADYYIGGVSGLGGGIADLTLRANLSALIFFPIANSNWTATDNPNASVLYGPDGAIIRTIDMSNVLTVDKTNVRTNAVFQAGNGASGTFTASGHSLTIGHGIVTGIT